MCALVSLYLYHKSNTIHVCMYVCMYATQVLILRALEAHLEQQAKKSYKSNSLANVFLLNNYSYIGVNVAKSALLQEVGNGFVEKNKRLVLRARKNYRKVR